MSAGWQVFLAILGVAVVIRAWAWAKGERCLGCDGPFCLRHDVLEDE